MLVDKLVKLSAFAVNTSINIIGAITPIVVKEINSGINETKLQYRRTVEICKDNTNKVTSNEDVKELIKMFK